jgi:hypothetical protein
MVAELIPSPPPPINNNPPSHTVTIPFHSPINSIHLSLDLFG